jgi:hypothetical protein
MNAYRGNRGIAPPILHLYTKCGQVVSFAPRPLYPRERPRYPFNSSLGKHRMRSGRSVEGKKLLLLPGFEVRTVQSQYRLRSPGCQLYKICFIISVHLLLLRALNSLRRHNLYCDVFTRSNEESCRQTKWSVTSTPLRLVPLS